MGNFKDAQTLCWECSKIVIGGCSWASCFAPVEGWEADYHPNNKSYCVRYCPEFVKDGRNLIDPREVPDEVIENLSASIVDNALDEYESALEYVEKHRRRFYEAKIRSDWATARDELVRMRTPNKVAPISEIPRWLDSEDAKLLGVGGRGELHLQLARQRMMMRRAFRDLKASMKSWSNGTEFHRMIEELDVLDSKRLQTAAREAQAEIGGRRGLLIKWAYESLVSLKPTYRLDTVGTLKKYVSKKRRGVNEPD